VKRVAPVGQKSQNRPRLTELTMPSFWLRAMQPVTTEEAVHTYAARCCAVLVRTQEAFLPAQRRNARHGAEFSVSDLCRQNDTPAEHAAAGPDERLQ